MEAQTKVRKSVIVAAGLGTRFLPITKSIPKEMLPVLNKPGLQYIVEEMADSGIEEVILVISKEKRAIKHYFSQNRKFEKRLKNLGKYDKIKGLADLLNRVKIRFAYQVKPLGNGHAILCAEKFIGNEPFVCSDADGVIAGDAPVTRQLLDIFFERGASVIGVQKISDKQAMTGYGNVYGKTVGERTYRVEKIVEKPSVENVSQHGLIIGGMRYIFTPAIWDALKKQKKSRDGEIWAADAADHLARTGEFYAFEYHGKFLDVGRVESWVEANEFFKTQVKV